MYVVIFYSIRRKQRLAANVNQNQGITKFFYFCFLHAEIGHFKLVLKSYYEIRQIVHHFFSILIILSLNYEEYLGIGSTHAERNEVYHYEWPVLIQAAWNCSALESRAIIFKLIVPFLIKIFGEEIIIPLGIFVNSYVILVCAVLPTVHLIYSKEAHNIIKHLLFMSFLVRLKNKITINVEQLWILIS